MANTFEIGSVVEIPVQNVEMAPNRWVPNEELPVGDLIADFKANGQLTPVLAWETKPGHVKLCDGHRRRMTAQIMGRPLICRIIEAPKNLKEEVLLRLGGNVNLGMSTMDKAVRMKQLVDAGFSKVDTAKRFVNSQGQCYTGEYVGMCLHLLNLVKEAQAMIHEGRKGCGVKWGIAMGKLSTLQQLEECKLVETNPDKLDRLKELIETEKGKLVSVDDPSVASPGQVKDDEEGNTTNPIEGTTPPKQETPGGTTVVQRTLKHVIQLLEGLIEAGGKYGDVSVDDAARVILGFIQDREAQMQPTVDAFRTVTGMKRRLKEIAEKAITIQQKADKEKADKEKATQAERDKANEERAKVAVLAVRKLKEAQWVPMAHKDGEEATKWKDPTNAKAKFVDTMEAYATQLGREASAARAS